ncbi:RNA 2',3'-cyclic phosphodiesterase [Tsuneonella sp. HG222]
MRLFVALSLPAPLRERLLALMDGVAGARWQDDAQLHITLAFLGDVPDERIDDLSVALAGVRSAPFPLAIRGVGHFERKGRPTALWAGVEPSDALTALHARVVAACRRAGAPPDAKAFKPHVTLARLPGGAGPVGPWIAAHGLLAVGPWEADRFALYASHLRPGGSVYEPLLDFKLSP